MIEGLETPTITDLVLCKVIIIEEDTTPIVEVHIINFLLDSHKDDLLSFTVYLEGTDTAMEVEGAEDGNKDKGFQIDTLLDKTKDG